MSMPKLNFYDTDAVKAFVLNILVENQELRAEVKVARDSRDYWLKKGNAAQAANDAAKAVLNALKKYLTTWLDAVGKDKVETVNAKISFRKSDQIQIDDESAPADFVKVVTETKPDKTAIKKAIKDGAEVPGATLIQNRNIQIK